MVDDDPDACETVRRFFVLHGFEVDAIDDSDAAINRVAAGDIDLVLIDFHHGGTSLGLKVLDGIRALPDVDAARTRAIMTTDLDENRVFSWQSGIDGFLIRPYHASDLLDVVTAALGRTDDERVAHRQEQMRATGDPRSRRAAGDPI